MLQDFLGARRRAVSPVFTQAFALLALAAGLVAAIPQAYGQAMQAAVGLYRPSISRFIFDGNFDHVTDLKYDFGATGLDVGLLGDLQGAGTRSPVLFRSGTWYFDSQKDGSVDTTISFGAAGDVPLMADIDGDGTEDPILFRNGTWYVDATHNGLITHTFSFGAAGDKPLIGDIDGTGTRLWVYRSVGGNGFWYGSIPGSGTVSRTVIFGGAPQDIPAMFDYDGDGKADLVIYRDGAWYVSTNQGASVTAAFGYGTVGDVPQYAGVGATSTQFLDAARFLTHASFGPVAAELTKATTMGFAAYIDDQFAQPATTLPVMAYQPQNQPGNCTSPLTAGGPADAVNFGTNCPRDLYTQFVAQRSFFKNAITAPDQLRQRVAWALSQIIVTSAANDPIGYANRNYQQLLQNLAFDNFWNILFRVSVDPLMGNYLDMVNNAKADPVKNTQPNENYAREVMQLFSVGLWELNQDGTLMLDAQTPPQPIPTYSQVEITEMAKIMTGWTYWPISGPVSWNAPINYLFNMSPCEGPTPPPGGVICGGLNWHDITAKSALGVNFAANQNADTDLRSAINTLFFHPNTGAFIGKQLIHHLVTSNPSPGYVLRITQQFNSCTAGFCGSGVAVGTRGDMRAVIKAILLDPEALAPRNPITSTFGKLKEPVMLVTNLLRAMNSMSDGVYPLNQVPNMDENVYTSPTVFNYYPADYVIPGTNLAGPQFGIFNATTYFPRANFMYNLSLGANCPAATPNLCGQNPDATVAGSTGTRIDYGQLTPFAGNTANLILQVNNLLLFGTMPPGMKLAIRNAIDIAALGGPSGPYTAQQLLDRARTAVYLVTVSPKYQLEF